MFTKHKLPTLNDASNYQRWLNSAQDHAFAMFKNTNISAIRAYEKAGFMKIKGTKDEIWMIREK